MLTSQLSLFPKCGLFFVTALVFNFIKMWNLVYNFLRLISIWQAIIYKYLANESKFIMFVFTRETPKHLSVNEFEFCFSHILMFWFDGFLKFFWTIKKLVKIKISASKGLFSFHSQIYCHFKSNPLVISIKFTWISYKRVNFNFWNLNVQNSLFTL